MNLTSPRAVVIRVATVADAPAVQSLFGEHLLALGLTPNPVFDADMAGFPATYSGPGDVFLIAASHEGQIVGMAGLLNAEVRRVHVKSPWRNRGLGQRLVRALMQVSTLPRDTALRAVVARDNLPSRRLFRQCGFIATGAAPAHAEMPGCEIFVRPAIGRPGRQIPDRLAA